MGNENLSGPTTPAPAALTGETITDEQIRELHVADAIGFDLLYRAVHRERLVGESQAAFNRARQSARARCAEILNARSAVSK